MPNECRVAEDRRDCYWLYIVTNCLPAATGTAQAGATEPTLQEPVKDLARVEWYEACSLKIRRRQVTKVAHYYLSVNAIRKPMQVREDEAPYGEDG